MAGMKHFEWKQPTATLQSGPELLGKGWGALSPHTYRECAPSLRANQGGVSKSRTQPRPGRLLTFHSNIQLSQKHSRMRREVDLNGDTSRVRKGTFRMEWSLSVRSRKGRFVSTQEFLNQSGSLISEETLPIVSACSYPLRQMKSSSRPYRPNASGHVVLAS